MCSREPSRPIVWHVLRILIFYFIRNHLIFREAGSVKSGGPSIWLENANPIRLSPLRARFQKIYPNHRPKSEHHLTLLYAVQVH